MDMENSFSPVPKPRTRFNIGSELSSSDANFQAEVIQENISEITGSKLTPENMSVSSFLFSSTPPVNDKTALSGRGLCTGTTVLNEKNVIITPPPKPSREFSELSTDILISTQYPSLYSSKSMTENHSLSAFPSRVIMSSSSNPSISTQSNESNSTAKLDLAFFPEGNNLEYKRIPTQVCSSYAASRPHIKFIENPLYMSMSTFRSLSLSKLEDDNKASDFNSSYNGTKPSGNWAGVLESTLSASGKSYFHSDNRCNSTSVWHDFLRTIEVYPLCSGVLSVKNSNNATIELDNDSLIANNTSGTAVAFFGFVTIHTGKKERKRAHAKLRNMELSFYDDDETDDILYGPYSLFDCQLVCREDNKISIRLNEKERHNPVIFTVDDSAETWSLLLGECWLSQFDLLRNNVPNNTACGTFWLRQGTNSKWMFTAAVFYERTMYYIVLNSPDYVYELDLRKVLTLREKLEKLDWCPYCKKKNQRGPFMLSLEGCSLYVECTDDWSTNKWVSVLQAALSLPCKILEEYRLTADNVPVIVDKCIRFMAAFGIRLEGIYRRNGKISEARDILAQLLNDPCGTHLLASTDETIYAVADVLRQFFRKLTNPLFPQNLHQQLFSLVKSQRTSADIILCEEYRQILQLMPVVHYYTLRKLMSHLKEVVSYSYINKASMDNLAKVFAPSLFHTDSEESGNYCFQDNSNEMSVIIDLLVGFDAIFQITTREEISRTMIEQAQLRKILNSKTVRANGLLVPIHMWERENRPFNIKTDLAAEEVCREAVARRGFDAPLDGHFAIFEMIRGGTLSRRLAPSEKLSCVVINRWLTWQCTDAFLLFDHDSSPYQETGMSSFCGKVKIADPGSKSFRSYELIVEDETKIAAYRNEKLWKKWNVDATVFYMGSEPNRKAPNPHTLTFFHMPHVVLTMKVKFVGYCISFKSAQDRYRFANLIEHIQTGGQPTPLVHL